MVNKLLIGVGASGLTIGAAVGAYQYLNKPEEIPVPKVLLNTRLTNEGFELLKLEENDAELQKVLTQYKTIKKNTFGTEEEAQNATAKMLIEKCKEALSSESTNDANYKLARQWCVKEATVATIFGKSGWKALENKGEQDEGGHWAKKVKEHKESSSDNKFSITLNEDNKANITQIKEECKKLDISKVKTTDTEFNKQFEQIKEWCAIKN